MNVDGGLDLLPPRYQRLYEVVAKRQIEHFVDPSVLRPWRRPCAVKALLVTDGNLNFGSDDFGMSAFVDFLLHDRRTYMYFDLTLAHLRSGVTDAEVQVGANGIRASIKGFTFDNPGHFTPDAYDEVWLFGIEQSYPDSAYPARAGTAYPSDRLSDAELAALTAHMNRGGGIFATGDHAALGRALCGSVDRVRSMRYWDSFNVAGQDEVSMAGPRRNDSNVEGHDGGSQFSDQSDDIPQTLDLRLYSTAVSAIRSVKYPHPVMCSRFGRIDVFPDHPHEGEVRTPADLSLQCVDKSPEYPVASDGSALEPEVVASGRVRAGNTAALNSGTKTATQAHTFGVVSTYDGHRAGVGRVVCDSTWHHFVNVNLIGIVEGAGFDDFDRPGEHASKHVGFLASPAGLAALDKIREYYVNVGVWIAPPERHDCMRRKSWWDVIWADRVVEATVETVFTGVEKASLLELHHIGAYATDVLGRAAGPCQTLEWNIKRFKELWVELPPWVDPWGPVTKERELEPRLPWIDPDALSTLAIGGAVAALREAFPHPVDDMDQAEQVLDELLLKGARQALERGLEQFAAELEQVRSAARLR